MLFIIKFRKNFKEKNFNFIENENENEDNLGSKNINDKINENQNDKNYLNELRIKYLNLLADFNKLKIEDQVYQNIEFEMNKDIKDEDDFIEIGI